MPALDGLKTVCAYLGDANAGRPVDELVPMLRRRQHMFLLQWAVFESCFAAASRADWTLPGRWSTTRWT